MTPEISGQTTINKLQNTGSRARPCSFRLLLCSLIAGLPWGATTGHALTAAENLTALGATIFQDASLSRDGKVSCQSCHDPAHAYADARPHSLGVDRQKGTRNAPSLAGIADDETFFWDGRRTRLDDAVIDPFTNPVELGLPSTDTLLEHLRGDSAAMAQFRRTYPNERQMPTLDQVQRALVGFIRSLATDTNAFERASVKHAPISQQSELGRRLFAGSAGCSECHRIDDRASTFSDGQFHHSGVEQTQSEQLPKLAQAVIAQNLDAPHLGPKVLTDSNWSTLGRFVVTHNPADIGAFRTPSLRNVAVTAPYMHDGSIATLSEAVDHEIYYRGFSSGHPINLSLAERQALVAFLQSLTDRAYVTAAHDTIH